MWLSAENISCRHGFSTRHGGISTGAFASLNLGGSEDSKDNVSRNRKIALDQLNLSVNDLCNLKQVHGIKVCEAVKGIQEGDAIVTNKKDLVLAVSIADCYPILFHDEKNSVIGAAHAGWRGTCGKIASETVKKMVSLGAQPEHIKVAIGQGISFSKFEVGPEVIEQFKVAGFLENCLNGNKIDLVACIESDLLKCGIHSKNIWKMNRCTFENDFFSYRRDKGITGRMWGAISM